MNNKQFYIGLMSGTSADGIDLALVDFSLNTPKLVTSYYQAYDDSTHQQITNLYQTKINEIDLAFSLDVVLAQQFAQAITNLLKQEQLTAADIIAIGNHGQTIRHRPNEETNVAAPFTLQIGCCKITLEVFEGNSIAQNSYQKFGFEGFELNPKMGKALFWQKNIASPKN